MNKKLTDDQAAKMIRHTAVSPLDRKNKIENDMKAMANSFAKDSFAKQFKFQVEGNMAKIPARVLPAPDLNYRQGGGQPVDDTTKLPDKTIKVKDGKWDMGRQSNLQFMDAKSLRSWGLLDLAGLIENEKNTFLNALYNEGRENL